ncbi:efflux transporter outer membrane subunit [Desulfosarcina ovata]|uniref:Membrane protein n=1 Tax=Desulfosarcina ovata subsp. ovata TaxID=2752305 RepID=A0A5K8ABV9_9BACT|nr:efflux transporter outer membrane subunit [Desulfosarcina ovata]BBO89440.1 membrane protein [Desulfosarcina ovata subsp. ovata]
MRAITGFSGLILILGILMLVSCAPFQPERIPDAPGPLPGTFAIYNAAVDVTLPWWPSLGSPELNRLIDEALSGSFTLKESWARLRQTEALAIQAGAERFPAVTASGSAESTRGRTRTTSNTSLWRESYLLALAGSYELDFWGRIRSAQEAALLDVSASRADLQTAAMTLTATVADRWLQILSLKRQEKLLREQLQSSQTFLELIELRFRKAMVSALDVYQQKQVVENIRAKIPLIEAETRLLEHELAVLIGRPPRADLELTQAQMPTIGPLPAVGLPADLLAHRPDVREAGLRLRAAGWQVAEARANRLPKLQLGADLQYGPNELDLFFDTWLISLAANLTAPIFDGGRLAAAVDLTRAQEDENLWAYRQAVLTAVKEVEDALESEARQREHIHGLAAVMEAARRGFEEAVQRYRRGLSDYLPVLTQLIAVQDLEQNLIQQQETLVRYRIALHRALGGDWHGMTEPMVPKDQG